MTPKQVLLKIKGMQRDLSDSSFKNDYAYENKNIRITADSDNGLLSVTTEKSTKKILDLVPKIKHNELSITVYDLNYNQNSTLNYVIKVTSSEPVANDIRIYYRANTDKRFLLLKKGETEVSREHGTVIPGFIDNDNSHFKNLRDDNYLYTLSYPNEIGGSIGDSSDENLFFKQIIIGTAEVSNNVVLFTVADSNIKTNKILLLQEIDSYYSTSTLYSGDLNFSTTHPIETLIDIENENIQKVYWVDGINQPRVINIKGEIDPNDPKQFDFVQEINGGNISVEQAETSGQFPAGVIQYAFTYFNKYGAESAVVDVSPIYYIANTDKGAEPNEVISKSFKITLSYLDNDWDYCRIYSIIRTSLNTTPEVRKVVDLKLNEVSTFIDTGSSGEYIAPTDLLYKGGEVLSASTIIAKDNTLFLGDINIENTSIVEEADLIKNNMSVYTGIKEFNVNNKPLYEDIFTSNKIAGKYYNWLNQLNSDSSKIKIFKTLDTYRLGVQLQDRYGKWSNPVFIGDYKTQKYPEHSKINDTEEFIKITTSVFKGYLDEDAVNSLYNKGYTKIRPVVVFPEYEDRECLCQGVLCPTVFNAKDRMENGPYSQSSWFIRPFNITDIGDGLLDESNNNTSYRKSGMWANNSHYRNLGNIITSYDSNQGQKSYDIYNINSEFSNVFLRELPDLERVAEKEVDHKLNSPFNIYTFVTSEGKKITLDNISSYSEGDYDVYYGNKGDLIIFNIDGLSHITSNTLDAPDLGAPVLLIHADSRDADGKGEPDLIYYSDNIDLIEGNEPSISSIVDSSVEFLITSTTSSEGNTNILKHVFSNYSENVSSIYTEEVIDTDYFIDNHIVTLHSPDIEFDSFNNNLLKNCKLRIVGIVPITSSNSTYSILGDTTTGQDYKGSTYLTGRGQLNTKIHSYNRSNTAYRHLINANIWHDFIYQGYIHQDAAFTVFPWNYSSLDFKVSNYAIKTKLKKIRLNTYQFSDFTQYYVNSDLYDNFDTINIQGVDVIAAVSNKDNAFINKIGNKFYYGNVDKLLNCKTIFPLYNNVNFNNLTGSGETITSDEDAILDIPSILTVTPGYLTGELKVIPVTYTSTKHAVIELPSIKEDNRVIETCLYSDFKNQVNQHPFWDRETLYEIQSMQYIPNIMSKYGFLLLGELYKEVDESARFGGTSEYAIQNNLWLPCGKPVTITKNKDITIEWTEGDTYYQRYDHIKTLPRNDEDLNGITSVISFMCESRINLDGKYSERELYMNNPDLITEDNFNKLNPVYSQQNNFFNYRILDSERFGFNNLPNTIAWTKTKHANAITDEWLNINLASSIDLDGGKGKVTALKKFNDNIVAFQNKGISTVLFNSRVQITPSDNIPIEIANSGKVDGYRYISDKVGCFNKHSICESPNGIYFIDDYNKSLYAFNGELSNISDSKGFHSFMRNNCNLSTWNPVDFNNVVTYRDPINKEVMFIYKDNCLAYNETLGEFSSFYSYDKVPFVFTLNDNVILAKDGKLHIKNGGDTYGEFFGKTEDSYVEYIVNDNPTYDKIFSTLDMRADVLDSNNKLLTNANALISPFNYLKVSNEYQEAISNLGGKEFIPKFRTWRAQFPRAGKDRIRNNWIRLKIGNINRTNFNHKVRLHDVVVNYFI